MLKNGEGGMLMTEEKQKQKDQGTTVKKKMEYLIITVEHKGRLHRHDFLLGL